MTLFTRRQFLIRGLPAWAIGLVEMFAGEWRPEPEPPPPPPPPDAVDYAWAQIGTPYVWGGASPGGFDCSGLVVWSYAQAGIILPGRTTWQLWDALRSVSHPERGDLVFWYSDVSHMGIMLDAGSFIHAPSEGKVVCVDWLNDYWAPNVAGYRRV